MKRAEKMEEGDAGEGISEQVKREQSFGDQYKKITPNYVLMCVFMCACKCITTYAYIY